MKKTISMLTLTDSVKSKIDQDSRFMKLFGLLVTYSPDQKTEFVSSCENDILSEKIIFEIDKSFFKSIYVDRTEKKDIIDDCSGRKLISIIGYAGVGKTVVLRKIKEEYKSDNNKFFAYMDCYEIARNDNSEQIIDHISTFFYNFVKGKGILDNYLQYLYKHFTPAPTKSSIDLLYGSIDEDDVEKWRTKLFSYPELRQELSDINSKRPAIEFIESAIEFIENELCIKVILCLDNLDKLPSSEINKVFYDADKINKACAIPVIVTLRENNIRKVLIEEIKRRSKEILTPR